MPEKQLLIVQTQPNQVIGFSVVATSFFILKSEIESTDPSSYETNGLGLLYFRDEYTRIQSKRSRNDFNFAENRFPLQKQKENFQSKTLSDPEKSY
jgi:hypothetical protein